jgi:hypothetical protein
MGPSMTVRLSDFVGCFWFTLAVVSWTVASSVFGFSQALPSKLIASSVYIQSGTSSASGFMVCHPDTPKTCHVFLITNKHAIPPRGTPAAIRLRVATDVSGHAEVKSLSVPIVGDDGEYLPSVRVNPNFDVVAIKITQLVKSNGVNCCFIDTDLFATKAVLAREKLTLGDQVFLLGYPAGIYDQNNASPILRQGVMATDPKSEFSFNAELQHNFGLPSAIPGFLIDANVYPGSSGSMVILRPQLLAQEAEGVVGVRGASNFYVLGVIFGSIPMSDVAIHSTERIGLGLVLCADTILETTRQFNGKAATP